LDILETNRDLMMLVQDDVGVMLAGGDFSLRLRETGDSLALFHIFDQPRCRQALALDPFGSANEVEAWFENLPAGSIALVATIKDIPIGFAGLQPCPGSQSHSGWISLFIHDEFHGRGFGTVMMKAIIAMADLLLGLRRVQLIVQCDNEQAIRLYRKFGFYIEGRHEWFCRRGDEFVAAFTMARLRKEPIARPADSVNRDLMSESIRDLLSLYRTSFTIVRPSCSS
jgi:putative acetyltransferase